MRWPSKMKQLVVLLVICAFSCSVICALDIERRATQDMPACPALSEGDVRVCSTPDMYPSAYLCAARDACIGYGYHLCSLLELVVAYDSGVRTGNTYWGLIDKPGSDAQLMPCDKGVFYRSYTGDECYVKEGSPDTWYLATTPRPYTMENAMCCKTKPVPFNIFG